MTRERPEKFLTVTRVAGFVFVLLGLVGMSWGLTAEGQPTAVTWFLLTFMAMPVTTAPREDLMARALADRTSVTFGRFVAEPLAGAGLCLLLLWIAVVVLGAFGVVNHAAGVNAAVLLSALLCVILGVQMAGTAFVLRKK
jgi:hypothetical protein